jgi:hypothetical protein
MYHLGQVLLPARIDRVNFEVYQHLLKLSYLFLVVLVELLLFTQLKGLI